MRTYRKHAVRDPDPLREPAGEAWKRTVRDPDESGKLSFRFMTHGADSRAVRLHKDASSVNRALNTELYEKGYYEDVPPKDRKRWLLRVASLARETSDLWTVTADAYEEQGDSNAAELASFKSRTLDRVAREYQRAAQSLAARRDPSDEEEVENWPLTEARNRELQRHIETAERSEVAADLKEAEGDLCESRARSIEAAAHYYAAADHVAVPTVHNRADLRRHNARIELLEHARRCFQRGRSYRNAERVQALLANLTSFGARHAREYGQ